ncbi:hypothetical protein BC937DRAFT_86814 [Endogone sp. FLAS-F59071]|nr:hypothetical protein BC937DRAFT_86814 [Endogone sp. FLAS-F59071]|eukprot:RUS19852.1 hypothetical protein BC937DRAFT_86814 [Endogone sp. FLAS-F59071]
MSNRPPYNSFNPPFSTGANSVPAGPMRPFRPQTGPSTPATQQTYQARSSAPIQQLQQQQQAAYYPPTSPTYPHDYNSYSSSQPSTTATYTAGAATYSTAPASTYDTTSASGSYYDPSGQYYFYEGQWYAAPTAPIATTSNAVTSYPAATTSTIGPASYGTAATAPIVVPGGDGVTGGDKDEDGKEKKKKKQKLVVRAAGGEVWEDNTLLEWDDDDFRLFCGDLGNEVTDEILEKAFSKYPSLLRAKVVRDKRTLKSKGYGFVSFKDPNEFVRAWREMNGKYVGNRPIKLRKSTWKDRNIDVRTRKAAEKAAPYFKGR